jgi:O-acetyl-ADP-ribose deacetylase
VMGTGAAVRGRGGFEILRACELIVEREGRLPAGTVWPTIAGALDARMVIHCVASDERHHSSDAIIAACVRNAMACAERAGCRTVAMPIFATGHAHVEFRHALETMLSAMRSVETSLEAVTFVVHDSDHVEMARSILGPLVTVTGDLDEVPTSWWDEDNGFG